MCLVIVTFPTTRSFDFQQVLKKQRNLVDRLPLLICQAPLPEIRVSSPVKATWFIAALMMKFTD
jgi:hypothetical protein